MLKIRIRILAFRLCNALFFLLYSVEQNLPLTQVVAAVQASRDIDCQVTA